MRLVPLVCLAFPIVLIVQILGHAKHVMHLTYCHLEFVFVPLVITTLVQPV